MHALYDNHPGLEVNACKLAKCEWFSLISCEWKKYPLAKVYKL